jgi:hypothetical protein
MMYLTGASNKATMDAAYDVNLGLMLNPDSRYKPNVHLPCYPFWAADNGRFSQGDKFNLDTWLRWLETLAQYQHKCLFVVAPDRFDPSGYWQGMTIAQATLERSMPVFEQVRNLGYSVALVAQNGLEDLEVPWGAFDVLFIGGDTGWKLSPQALMIARDNKHVHMGRVNSGKRFIRAAQIGCDSCDGTFIKYGPDINLQRMLRWQKVGAA